MENTDKKIKEIMDRRLTELTRRYPVLGPVRDSIGEAYLAIKESYDRGGKLMVAGNGGSCADALHIVGELMKGFCKKRPLPEELKDAIISSPRKKPARYHSKRARPSGSSPKYALPCEAPQPNNQLYRR